MNQKTTKPIESASTDPAESMSVIGSDLVKIMASEQHLDHAAYAATVKATCFDGSVTREQFLAFLMVAKEHKLNPITREIYGFAKGGKITPIVSIDGWLKIINSHPDFDGMEFEDHLDDEGKLLAITCKIYRQRNGRPSSRPTQVTEYLEECFRQTEPWKKWPIRMLRHKATIQCARYAFGFSGIVDADEAERIKETSIDGVARIVPDDDTGTAAKRLVNKLHDKVPENATVPENANHAVSVDPVKKAPDEAPETEGVDKKTGEVIAYPPTDEEHVDPNWEGTKAGDKVK